MTADPIADHMQWLEGNSARASTVKSRHNILRLIQRSLPVPLLDASREQVETWFSGLRVEPRTKGNYLAHLRQFYKWAQVWDIRTEDPTLRITAPKTRRTLPRPLPEDEVSTALNEAPARLRPMLLLMVGCGLRCMEVAKLRAEDVTRFPDGSGRAFIRDGKGGKQRFVPLPPVVVSAVTGPDMPAHGWLFPIRDGQDGPLTAHRLSCLVNEYLHSVGITATAHALRHTYATALYKESGDLLEVRDVLGHESVATTQVYVAISGDRAAGAATRVSTRLIPGAQGLLDVPNPLPGAVVTTLTPRPHREATPWRWAVEESTRAKRPIAGCPLTSRQLEVLALMAEGCTGPQIAARLGISHNTSSTQAKKILRILDVGSRTAAVMEGQRRGWLQAVAS